MHYFCLSLQYPRKAVLRHINLHDLLHTTCVLSCQHNVRKYFTSIRNVPLSRWVRLRKSARDLLTFFSDTRCSLYLYLLAGDLRTVV